MPFRAPLVHRVELFRDGLALSLACLLGVCALLGCNHSPNHRYGGYVEAEKIEVGSRVGGRIERVFVEEGSEVKKGDLLVQFEKVHLEAQLEEARQRAARLQAALDKAVAGPRPQEIAIARQNYDASVARAKRAADDYKRGVETGVKVITREKLDEFETAMKVAKSDEQARKQEVNMLEEGTRAEDVIIARRQLEETQAQVRFAEDQLHEAEVRAPVDAVVEVCDLQPGDLVSAGVPLATLVRKDELWVRSFVPTAQLTLIHPGQKVKVTVDSRPGETFDGEVLRVNRVAEYTPRNVQTYEKREDQVFGVKVRVKDTDDALRPGMAATVEIAE